MEDKKHDEKSTVEKIVSTLEGRANVGSEKKGVDLLHIVQKLTRRRERSKST